MNGPVMINYIVNQISLLEDFVATKTEGLTLEGKDYVNDVDVLLAIKHDLLTIEKESERYTLLLDVLLESCNALIDEKNMSKQSKKRDQLQENYTKLLKLAKETKKEIASVIGIESNKCRTQITDFEVELNDQRKNLKNKPFFK